MWCNTHKSLNMVTGPRWWVVKEYQPADVPFLAVKSPFHGSGTALDAQNQCRLLINIMVWWHWRWFCFFTGNMFKVRRSWAHIFFAGSSLCRLCSGIKTATWTNKVTPETKSWKVLQFSMHWYSQAGSGSSQYLRLQEPVVNFVTVTAEAVGLEELLGHLSEYC